MRFSYFERFTTRHTSPVVPDTSEASVASANEKDTNVNNDLSGSDSDRLSLEARNEKDVLAHPDEVTADAQLGVKKAEAAAIVWPAWALYCVYGW